MGAFNTVRGPAACPACGRSGEFEVQFKYGDTWQHSYQIGDRLRWGGNDIGTRGYKRVLVESMGGPCPDCREQFLDFDIRLEDDVIVAIEPVHGERISGPEGFVVLEK